MKRIRIVGVIIFFSFIACCHADLDRHLKKIENKVPSLQIKNIDFIYLINLDQRPEKLENCMQQLAMYEIYPHRFSAIYGWDLSLQALNEIGVKFGSGMRFGLGREHWVLHFPLSGNGNPVEMPLDRKCFGKTFFSRWITRGAIGCTLSHLSILQDAYDAGYETIWILEDDILIRDNPHHLADFIEKLDTLVGTEGWDVLYTDNNCFRPFGDSRDSELNTHFPWMWRPDLTSLDLTHTIAYTDISVDFAKIGGRTLTHSMIVRRSGMKKIIDYEKTHGIFIPYDHELSFVPDIQLYILKSNIVSTTGSISDTRIRNF